jgi:hypothetical protein
MFPIPLDTTSLLTGAGVALAIISTVLTFMLRWQKQKASETAKVLSNVKELVGALTDDKGQPTISCGADKRTTERHEQHFQDISEKQAEHSLMHRKQFSALRKLDKGQREIVDYLTSSDIVSDRPPKLPEPVADSIELEKITNRPSSY